ncbi:MAG: UDP-glucose 4-epimerase GalE [Micropepsaceae bacterium]
MRVLLIGGAGYIGSSIAHHLLDEGHEPFVLDNLSTGALEAVPAGVPFCQADCGDAAALAHAITNWKIEAVVQLAAAIRVEESVAEPAKYYFNNTVKSLSVFDTCARAGVRDFVFSSTAAVYGEPAVALIDEGMATNPANPYGHSKLAAEFMLRDIARVSNMRATIFRYFNVAGADPKLRTGQRTQTATHLIKVAAQVAAGARAHLDIYGTDYPTPDGTAIRDYIHVTDLAQAHVLALTKPGQAGQTRLYNCGYGTGHSVREVAAAFGQVLNHALPTRDCPRRPGDVAQLACDAAKLKAELGWTPRHASMAEIVQTALDWERKLAR